MKYLAVGTVACTCLLATVLLVAINDSASDTRAEQEVMSPPDSVHHGLTLESEGAPARTGIASRLPGSIYGAKDFRAQESELRHAAAPFGFDAGLLHLFGIEFCSYIHDRQYGSFMDLVERGYSAQLPQALASAKMLDERRARYCDASFKTADDQSATSDQALSQAAAAGDIEADALLRMKGRIFQSEDEIGEQESGLIQQRASDIAAHTASPGLFLEASMLLADPAFHEWMPEGFNSRGVNVDDLPAIKNFGALMAMCDEFGVCSNQSIFTLRYCMPTQCDPRRGMEGYLRQRMNEEQYAHAERYASALRAMRQR